MKSIQFLTLFFLLSLSANAQITAKDTVKMGYTLKEGDTISEPIQLEEIVLYKEKMDPAARLEFLKLQNRVLKVYPYAKIASERLTALNYNMSKLKTAREKRKYYKIVEDYLENEFSEQLKKLSRKQGQILVKLINRQTGATTYDLIRDYKSGWKAFWSNSTARLFDLNLKTAYEPYTVNEDYLIETILYRAFNRGRLVKQEPAHPINYDDLSETWAKKSAN